mgnify:CR=1 FL=1
MSIVPKYQRQPSVTLLLQLSSQLTAKRGILDSIQLPKVTLFLNFTIITQSTIPHIIYYSVLNASTGSFFAAILDGIMLAISVSTKLRAISPIDA